MREFYTDMYAEDGGVPAAGAYINYPDVDLASRSWEELYFGANHARLRRVKARWDPLNVFHHALSATLGA